MRNPFIDTRLESELDPQVWFSGSSREISAEGKSTYIHGTRGSGKTCLLRSLSTRHINQYSSLRRQLEGKQLNWFGVYIRLQDRFDYFLEGPILDKSTHASPLKFDHSRFEKFAHNIEVFVLQEFCRSLRKLQCDRFLAYSEGAVFDAIQRLLSDVSALKKHSLDGLIESLYDVEMLCGRILDLLYQARSSSKPENEGSRYISSKPGAILKAIKQHFLPIIKSKQFKFARKMHFKVLLDDCEALPTEYQVYLNTIIRDSVGTASWAVAFVSNSFDTVSTIRRNQQMSDADRRLLYLDDISDSEFQKLCQHVCALRLWDALPQHKRKQLRKKKPHECFDLKKRLGKYSYNGLIEESMSNSISPEWRQFCQSAEKWAEVLSQVDLNRNEREQLDIPKGERPYTIAVAAQSLGFSTDTIAREMVGDDDRKRITQSLNRKNLAAFLEIGRRYSTTLRLGGHRIVTSLSDNCIRDFLNLMREVFAREVGEEVTEGKLMKFVDSETPVKLSVQSASIYATSKAKYSSVGFVSDPFGDEVLPIVNSLGLLTRAIQVNGDDSIRNPESGRIKVNWEAVAHELKRRGLGNKIVYRLLETATSNGFVRELNEKGEILKRSDNQVESWRYFRLHRMLSPYFGYSFRGPYSTVTVSANLFAEVLSPSRPLEPLKWANQVLRSLNKPTFVPEGSSNQLELNQLDLPFGTPEDE